MTVWHHPPLETSGDPVVDDEYMSGPQQLASPRKRQRAEQHPLQLNEASQPQSKKPKRSHHATGPYPPPAFWDNLSKIWLTKDALRELDRRNTQSAPNPPRSPYRRAHRPVTRSFLAEVKKIRQPTQSAADYLRHCAARTLKDVKLFARHGGPDLSDLTGHSEPLHPPKDTMSSSQSTSRPRKRGSASTTTKKTTATKVTKVTGSSGPYNPNFQQRLIDSGVYPYGYTYPDGRRPPLPANWKEINERLVQPRPSLSPSAFPDEQYEEFVQADAKAVNEDEVKDSVLPAMLRAIRASSGAQRNILFGNLTPLTDNITQARPDYYYGAQPEQIHQNVRNDLSSHIIPSTSTNLPAVPNFFLEAKGPDGSGLVSRRQSCHYGAIGARAIHSLQSYRAAEPVYDNSGYTISSTYQEGQLKMYSHSIARPNGTEARPEYYMHQLKGWSMTGDKDAFLQGAAAFKNARDWTGEHRNAAIACANEMVSQTIEDEEGEDTEGKEGDDTDDEGADDDKAEAESSNTMFSFASGTGNPIHSTLAEHEDEDENPDDSETSIDELAYAPPPAKRPSSKSHKSHRRSSAASGRRKR